MSNTSLVRLCVAILLGMTAAAAQDRMPPIPADKMTDAQKKAAAELAAGPRGAYSSRGPFVPLVRSPELMSRVQKVGEYLRYGSSLPQKLVEMTVLMTARRWTQQFEWNAHYPLALKVGLKKDVADAIAELGVQLRDIVARIRGQPSRHPAIFGGDRQIGERSALAARSLQVQLLTLHRGARGSGEYEIALGSVDLEQKIGSGKRPGGR